jgi:hypothetical protein
MPEARACSARDNDAVSMAASIEQRLPLVDQALLAAVVRLPDGRRFQPIRRKAALRRTGLRGLDPAVFERERQGFVLPFERWIRQGQHRAVGQHVAGCGRCPAAGLAPEAVARLWEAFLAGAPGLYWSCVWALYVLVRWCSPTGCGHERPPLCPGDARPGRGPLRAPHPGRRARATEPPALWVVVDDGSKDETPAILAQYAARPPCPRVVRRPDRGDRKLGGGVIDAFYAGYQTLRAGGLRLRLQAETWTSTCRPVISRD